MSDRRYPILEFDDQNQTEARVGCPKWTLFYLLSSNTIVELNQASDSDLTVTGTHHSTPSSPAAPGNLDPHVNLLRARAERDEDPIWITIRDAGGRQP